MYGKRNQQLGFLPGAAVAASAGLGPVGVAIVISVSVVGLYETFKDWFQRGELKLAATAKAEEYVDSVWGTRTPNSPPTQDSVSKLIEACQLDAAQELINFLARQMYEKAAQDSYFDRWMKEYGFLTLTQVQNKLAAYRGYCMIQSEPGEPAQTQCPADFTLQNGTCVPLQCPAGFYLSGGKCIPISPATLPPAINDAGQYVPLPQATLSKAGMFGILAAALALIVISR